MAKEMRAVYTETLIEEAQKNKNIIVMEADLMKATGTTAFQKACPNQTVNVGVAEANLVGVAAGLSVEGKIPFAATFGCFASRRAFDQFFLSANYAKLNVKLVGTDPGISAAFNGGTHMPFEDIALMKTIPHLTIVEPSDPISLKAIIQLVAKHEGCVYMRLHRKGIEDVYKEGERFELGKAKVLREGSDITIAALGPILVCEALKAADELAKEGIKATVIDVITIKPFDKQTIFDSAKKTGKLITAENHQLSGGFGSAVAEEIAECNYGFAFKRIGVKDQFGEVGTQAYLQEKFGMSAKHIIALAKSM
ncbi:MAG: transketolase family protein [Treponemataceae bacterium]